MKAALIHFATERHRWVYAIILTLLVVLGLQLPRIQIDTDPENMLPGHQPERMFHDEVEKRFNLYDVVVVGAVNETDPNGIYNVKSLSALYTLTKEILNLNGVVSPDLMSLSEADNITQGEQNTLRFEWMMKDAPTSQVQVEQIRTAVERLPLLRNTLVSGDGKAAAIYVPIESKDLSYDISQQIKQLTDKLDSDDNYYITGLPVAEDTFGHDMFLQMGISAPLAGLMIFLLMWYFFRSATLVVAPMLVAIITVVLVMGLLIGSGFTVHIMSSMIPIFLMPIAVVDSVHIMSEFADLYKQDDDPKAVISEVVDDLFTPMLYTSLTSAIGFASLLLTPIPPVQVFGGFVAFGILLAFLLTIVFIPAYVVRMNPKRLEALHRRVLSHEAESPLCRVLRAVGRFAFGKPLPIIGFSVILLAISAMGVSRIVINDNPVRWFKPGHEIRVADRVLNEHFAGTYDAYLVLTRATSDADTRSFLKQAHIAVSHLSDQALIDQVNAILDASPFSLESLVETLDDAMFDAQGADSEVLESLLNAAENLQSAGKYFQRPGILKYIESLQNAMMKSGYVGKSNSLTDVVKVVNRELRSGEDEDYTIPTSINGVAQTLLQYQSSHRPQDLWHMVTPDFTSTSIWIQLKSGDNQDMNRLTGFMQQYLRKHPPPEGVDIKWAGKTYINVIWQSAMVTGMLKSLLGAFVIVFFMMVFLFRSVSYGLIAMLPLTLTITLVYGFIGWIGKYYDMPIAVLSALTLGLSVDFAIHFLERFRSLLRTCRSFVKASREIFEEPARAIFRNAVVIAFGFTPLFLAPLEPYITVGAFMAGIMAISCLTTLLLLPAIMSAFSRWLSPNYDSEEDLLCSVEN